MSLPPFNAPSFTCPRCGAVSYHPTDVSQGYCNRCHDWTRSGPPLVTRAVLRLYGPGAQVAELEITDVAGPVTSAITDPAPPDVTSTAVTIMRTQPPRTLTVTISARRFRFRILDGQPSDREA